MADSWEDEDASPPIIPVAPVRAPAGNGAPIVESWEDDDEDLVVQEIRKQKEQQAAEFDRYQAVKAENDRKKMEKETAKRLAELQLEDQANETAEERRIRERRQVEEADQELSQQLFDGKIKSSGSGGGVGGANAAALGDVNSIRLVKLIDYSKLGNKLGARLAGSKNTHVKAFMTALLTEMEPVLEQADCQEYVDILNQYKREKQRAAAELAKKNKAKDKKNLSRKEEKNLKKHVEDVFGGGENEDQYADYYDVEDDFM